MKKSIWGILFLLAVFFITATVLISLHEKSVLMDESRRDAKRELSLMGTFVRESVIRRDYAQVEQAVMQWGKERADIQTLRATTGTGFVIGEYKKEKASQETLTVIHKEKIPGTGKIILLEMKVDLTQVFSHIRQIVIRLAITWACLSLLLGLCLWWILNVLSVNPLKKEINARQQAEAELQKARDGLEIQVQARTAELSEANIDLEKEITERKHAEDEAQQARREWENIFQAIGHPVMILDPAHGLISANRATIELTGSSEKELVGKHCFELMHGTKKPPAGCPMQTMIAAGGKQDGEMAVESFGRTFFVTCTPVNDQQGKLQKCIHIATDITQQKQDEAELRKHRDHLEELVNERTAELESKNAELERMNRLFVGRELRMVELKEEIRRLNGNK